MTKNIDFDTARQAYTAVQTVTSTAGDYNYAGANNCLGWHASYSYPYQAYPAPDKTATAFSIARKLMAKDLIEVTTVKQFITLIDTLVSAL